MRKIITPGKLTERIQKEKPLNCIQIKLYSTAHKKMLKFQKSNYSIEQCKNRVLFLKIFMPIAWRHILVIYANGCPCWLNHFFVIWYILLPGVDLCVSFDAFPAFLPFVIKIFSIFCNMYIPTKYICLWNFEKY